MTPLRVEHGRIEYVPTTPDGWSALRRSRHLVLCDHEQLLEAERASARSVRSARRARSKRIEAIVLGAVVLCVLAYFVATAASGIWKTAAANLQTSAASIYPVVTVRVAQGDTLWTYATRYGDPSSYILDRVDAIARENSLSSQAPLTPGQILKISVQNPVEIARLQHRPAA